MNSPIPETSSSRIASEAASSAKRQAESLYRNVSSGAAATADQASDAMEDAASALDESGHDTLGKATAALAEHVRRFSAYLESRGLEDVGRDAYRLVQRNPAAFIAGGVVLGFALSQIFKIGAKDTRKKRRLF